MVPRRAAPDAVDTGCLRSSGNPPARRRMCYPEGRHGPLAAS
jgi:hypothetical protein